MSQASEPGGAPSGARRDPFSAEASVWDRYVQMARSGELPPLEEDLETPGGPGSGEPALPFERIGDYRLLRRLGQGGMGMVYLAVQTSLRRQVALKLLRPELVGSAVASERLAREARALARLRHPHIVSVLELGEERGVLFMAMDYVPGRSLAEVLQQPGGTAASVVTRVRWGVQLARALACAHAHGIIHRDVKPSNVRIAEDGRAMLVDFGLARGDEAGAAGLTESFVGSPAYASPEQIRSSAEVDARTDVYSLGVTLYHALAGRVPFEGSSMGQVFQQVLSTDPPSLRRLDPTLSRDLETVVHRAMERDPARRYATAAELAEDLEAVLELRPIRGRPPGLAERLRRVLRRHPGLAIGSASALLALGAAATLWGLDVRARRVRREAEALEAVAAARALVERYRRSRQDLSVLQNRLESLRQEVVTRWLGPQEYDLLDRNEEQVARLEREWEATFYAVLDGLREAERLDPDVEGCDRVRAELYLEKLREARQARDRDAVLFYRDLVQEAEPGGPVAAELAADSALAVGSHPPGAEVRLYRLVEQSSLVPEGEPRVVPVPLGDDTGALPPGTWCLRVLADLGPLRRNDLVFEIEGQPIEGSVWVVEGSGPVARLDRLVRIDADAIGNEWAVRTFGAPQAPPGGEPAPSRTFVFERGDEEVHVQGVSLDDLGVRAAAAAGLVEDAGRPPLRARVARGAALLEVELPPALPVRATARPLLVTEQSLLGHTPLPPQQLAPGEYLLVLRHPDCEELRFPLTLSGSAAGIDLDLELKPLGSGPPGFVWIPPPGGDLEGFWIQEREVTCAEYARFLADPLTQREIADSKERLRVPRSMSADQLVLYWRRDATGRLTWPEGWDGDWPVLGISFEDAEAFARWRTRTAQEAGSPLEFSLPGRWEEEHAAGGGLPLYYTYGNRFRPRWSHTCFAHRRAYPGPVLSFPVDESPFGVFDLCGGAFEWVDAWFDEGRALRFLKGGAWGQAVPELMSIPGGTGARPETTSGETGLRLIARPRRER